MARNRHSKHNCKLDHTKKTLKDFFQSLPELDSFLASLQRGDRLQIFDNSRLVLYRKGKPSLIGKS